MRSGIWVAALLGALALVACGGSKSNGSSSSGGSSGGTTTGGSSGSSGTTGSNGPCGPQSAICQSGQRCNTYTELGTGNSLQACGCTPGRGAVPDSCAANTNGLTVCDPLTLACRKPRDFEPPNTVGVFPDGGGSNTACDAEHHYDTIRFSGGSVACVQYCFGSGDCSSASTSCAQPAYRYGDGGPSLGNPGDGGLLPLGICYFNLCGPHAADDGGVLRSDFYQRCDAKASGDGLCLPILDDGNGLCQQVRGDAGPGSICDPTTFGARPEKTCNERGVCLASVGPPGASAICFDNCNANARPGGSYDLTCPPRFPDGGTDLTCRAFTTAPGDGGFAPGYCGP